MADTGLYRIPKQETFGEFLWNSEKKQFLGRTGASWCKIGVFYVIFYACLAGFFAVMLTVFYQTLDTHHMPKYTPGDGSSLLRHPAMGFRPLPRIDNVESTLIWYKNGNNEDIRHWTESLDEFIKPYEGTGGRSGQHEVDCGQQEPTKDDVCKFDDTWLKDKCHKNEKWGYNRESPCVILKLNRMINWLPEVYEKVEELPDSMPESLVTHIKEEIVNKGFMPKMIWVSCKGENPADEEYVGPILYSPWQGFPAYYFPFRNTDGYLPPIVAIQFSRPESNVLINIECRAWAKNIKHDRQNRLGLVHFELLKD